MPSLAGTESGPYSFSRNPIYLADLVILAGVALVVGAPLALILLVPFQQVLLRQFILPEEAVRQPLGFAIHGLGDGFDLVWTGDQYR